MAHNMLCRCTAAVQVLHLLLCQALGIMLWVPCRTADSVHVGPAGVLALAENITRPVLEGMLADAHEFVAEWQEMRPVFQHRLFGQCLRAPLQVLQYFSWLRAQLHTIAKAVYQWCLDDRCHSVRKSLPAFPFAHIAFVVFPYAHLLHLHKFRCETCSQQVLALACHAQAEHSLLP